MDGGIYLIQRNGEIVKMTPQPYDSENLLQTLIAKYPSLLAGDQIDMMRPRRWLLVAREAGLPLPRGGPGRWAVDHLFLDQQAIPTLVEVKRNGDARMRRETLGQMLDYAAYAVTHWSAETLSMLFEETCRSQGQDPAQRLSEFLGSRTLPRSLWQMAQDNLESGRVRLVFVADEVSVELSRVVAFLNRQMTPAQVLAVEIKQYVGSGLKTLVPRLIAEQTETPARRSGSLPGKRQWDEQSFFDDLESKRGPQEAEVAREIMAWAEATVTRCAWGKGAHCGTFTPVIGHQGRDHRLFAVWTSGVVEIYFHWYTYKPPFDSEEKRLKLLYRLNAIPGVRLPADSITGLPTISLSALAQERALERFLSTFEWVVEEITACSEPARASAEAVPEGEEHLEASDPRMLVGVGAVSRGSLRRSRGRRD